MQIQINYASNRPVYQQIIDQIKRDIALGRLVKDDKLPTVRHLAENLAVNPNTIGKAYRLLEQEGVITTRPGAGAFVARLDSQLSQSFRHKLLAEQIERLLVEAVHMQIGKDKLQEWFDEALEKFDFEQKRGRS